MLKMTSGQIIREVAATFLMLYAFAFVASGWIVLFQLSVIGPAAGFAYPLLAVVSAVLCGVSGWWMTGRRLWLWLGLTLSLVCAMALVTYGMVTEGPLRGGLPPPFGAVMMAGLPGVAYFVPRATSS